MFLELLKHVWDMNAHAIHCLMVYWPTRPLAALLSQPRSYRPYLEVYLRVVSSDVGIASCEH